MWQALYRLVHDSMIGEASLSLNCGIFIACNSCSFVSTLPCIISYLIMPNARGSRVRHGRGQGRGHSSMVNLPNGALQMTFQVCNQYIGEG